MVTERFGVEAGRLAALIDATSELREGRDQEAQEPGIETT